MKTIIENADWAIPSFIENKKYHFKKLAIILLSSIIILVSFSYYVINDDGIKARLPKIFQDKLQEKNVNFYQKENSQKVGQLNVFGNDLELCCLKPVTGVYRDGFCNTGNNDIGTHTVCAIVTDEFLLFSKKKGNDLTRDVPIYNFKGLKAGDKWCLCALRWVEAFNNGCAPKLLLESTNIRTLDFLSLEKLLEYQA